MGYVDGDEDLDLFMGQSRTSGSELYLKQADGSFVKKEQKYFSDSQLIPFKDMGSLFLDADSDGDLDLYVASGGYDPAVRSLYLRDRLFLNQGKGEFVLGLPNTPDLVDASGAVCVNDFDRDGDLDLFVGGQVVPGKYPVTPNSRLLVNQGVFFQIRLKTFLPDCCRLDWLILRFGVIMTATDGSIFGLPVSGVLSVSGEMRTEYSKETTESLGLSNTKGWWTSILPVDIDSDGDMDYAVGNLGYNTKYTASMKEPLVLHWGEMDDSGKPRLIEACYKSGKFLPIRGKSCSTNAIPSLADKFKTFHAFASAELTDIYQPKFLDQSLRIEINELASGIWLNEGGEFRFKNSFLAQTSSVFGMSTADFNGDGWIDLGLVQNFFPMQPETGRVNGGLGMLLLGSESGKFLSNLPRKAGL